MICRIVSADAVATDEGFAVKVMLETGPGQIELRTLPATARDLDHARAAADDLVGQTVKA